MKQIVLVLIVLALVVGCAGSPANLATMNETQLSTVTDDQLISALGNRIYRNNQMFQEALQRSLLTEDEIVLIKDRKIRIGMSETALIASWGSPNKINRSVGNYGVHKQYIYGSYSRYSSRTYVYVENGKVTSWQD